MGMNSLSNLGIPLTISSLQQQYATAQLSPSEVVEAIIVELEARGDDGIWTHTLSKAELRARAIHLENNVSKDLPLWGIPFSINKICFCICFNTIKHIASIQTFDINNTTITTRNYSF